MKFAAMRFDGMSLRHNPEKLTISGKNHIREYTSPCCEADSLNLGRDLRRASGEGELCGVDCLKQYRALERLCIGGKCAKLVLPGIQPMYAYLKELSLIAEPLDNVLSYRFTFVEAQSPRQGSGTGYECMTASQGDSLWNIAYAFSVPVEKLVELNPQLPRIDCLNGGERVRIC